MPKVKRIFILANTHPSKQIKHFIDWEIPMPKFWKEGYESTVRSQFKLAKFIEKNPTKTYIYENNYDLKFGMHPDFDARVKKLFPGDLPKNYNSLSPRQKDFLAYHGGMMICVSKKIVHQTYADNPLNLEPYSSFLPKIGIKDGNIADDKQSSWFDLNREYLAIANGVTLGNALGKEEIYLVYGGAHLFTDLNVCFPEIEISKINLESLIGDYSRISKENELADNKLRPSIDCEAINRQFFKPPILTSGKQEILDDFHNPNQILGTLVLFSLMAYGFYKLAKWFLEHFKNASESTPKYKMS